MLAGDASANGVRFDGEDNSLMSAMSTVRLHPTRRVGSSTFKDNSFHGGSDRIELFHVELLIKATGKKKRKLNRKGKVRVRPTITYTPTGGTPRSEQKSVRLKKRRRR